MCGSKSSQQQESRPEKAVNSGTEEVLKFLSHGAPGTTARQLQHESRATQGPASVSSANGQACTLIQEMVFCDFVTGCRPDLLTLSSVTAGLTAHPKPSTPGGPESIPTGPRNRFHMPTTSILVYLH